MWEEDDSRARERERRIAGDLAAPEDVGPVDIGPVDIGPVDIGNDPLAERELVQGFVDDGGDALPYDRADDGEDGDDEAALSGPPDHDLIRRAQQGEEAAFETLVRRHQAKAYGVARNLVTNREDASDLVQEAFLRVFRSLERFDFEYEFPTWLYRIVTNLAIDHLRKRRPAMSTTSTDEEGVELDLADENVDAPSEPMERDETARRVRECIDSLAPHFRVVLTLRELEGLACTEIARIVGATHVTVRWRLHRGRKLFLEEWERRERMAQHSGAVPGEEQAEARTSEKGARKGSNTRPDRP